MPDRPKISKKTAADGEFDRALELICSQAKRIELLESALLGLAGDDAGAPCWCEVAIGNPMFEGRHSPACQVTREVLEGTATAGRIAFLEAKIGALEGVLHMTVARLGGIVEGRPTSRVNFLQRVDELVGREKDCDERLELLRGSIKSLEKQRDKLQAAKGSNG